MSDKPAPLVEGMQVTPTVRLVSSLGSGGMGAVWLAEHTGLKTAVVVKFMLEGLDESSSARARFSREAAVAAQVKSPHVVQMLDHGVTDDGVPFIVMEHLEGKNLGTALRERGVLEPKAVVAIVVQVARALSRVHGAGLLHRDIKPDNVFLCDADDDDVYVKLLDFGIAKLNTAPEEASLGTETKTGQVVGTPFYMSPEQVTAQKDIDERSDLWALGVVAYECMTGKRPYDGASFGALAVKIATGTPTPPSDVNPALPPSVDAWFARACAREPAARFATAKELADGLRAAFEGVVVLPAGASLVDSGPRTQITVGEPGRVATPSRPSDAPAAADSRPSFVLASTVQDEPHIVDSSSLARSEAGTVADARRATSPSVASKGLPRGVLVFAALAVLGGAAFVVSSAGQTDSPVVEADASTAASVSVSSARAPAWKPAAPRTDVVASARQAATVLEAGVADAGTNDGGASEGHASALPVASSSGSSALPPSVVADGGVHPIPSGAHSGVPAQVPSASPSGSASPPASSSTPPAKPANSHDDPLF